MSARKVGYDSGAFCRETLIRNTPSGASGEHLNFCLGNCGVQNFFSVTTNKLWRAMEFEGRNPKTWVGCRIWPLGSVCICHMEAASSSLVSMRYCSTWTASPDSSCFPFSPSEHPPRLQWVAAQPSFENGTTKSQFLLSVSSKEIEHGCKLVMCKISSVSPHGFKWLSFKSQKCEH